MSTKTITITETDLRSLLRRMVNAASIDAAANISDDAVVERMADTPAWREAWPAPVAPGTPGTPGTATLNNRVSGNSALDMRVMRTTNSDGALGFAVQNGLVILDDAVTWSISDFVPDAPAPKVTRAQVFDILYPDGIMPAQELRDSKIDALIALFGGAS